MDLYTHLRDSQQYISYNETCITWISRYTREQLLLMGKFLLSLFHEFIEKAS